MGFPRSQRLGVAYRADPSTKGVHRLEQNAAVLGVSLSAEDLATLDSLADQVVGSRCFPEMTPGSVRGTRRGIAHSPSRTRPSDLPISQHSLIGMTGRLQPRNGALGNYTARNADTAHIDVIVTFAQRSTARPPKANRDL